jgi:cystathionine beta-lyase
MTDTTTYNFDQTPNRRDSESDKWKKYDEDVLPMWVADMDFQSPQPVIDALVKRVEHGVFGYPGGMSTMDGVVPPFHQAVIERMAELYNWEIEPHDIVPLPGVVTGFNLACHAFAKPDQAVLVQTPVYQPMLHAAKNTGRQRQEMQLTRDPDGSYRVDWNAFEASISPQTRLFILCNPHNPVGKVFTQSELERMAEICLRHEVIICSDEIHCDLVFSGHSHTPLATLDPEISQNIITLMAPSKTYNIAGLQCSFAIIQNENLRRKYQKARKGLVPWVNLIGMLAGTVAFREGGNWLKQVLTYLQNNRDILYKTVKENLPGIDMHLTEGTYLAWLDCRQAGIEGNPYKFFLEEAQVAFNDGTTYGRGGEGFVRLNFGCPRPILEEALQRMSKALT